MSRRGPVHTTALLIAIAAGTASAQPLGRTRPVVSAYAGGRGLGAGGVESGGWRGRPREVLLRNNALGALTSSRIRASVSSSIHVAPLPRSSEASCQRRRESPHRERLQPARRRAPGTAIR